MGKMFMTLIVALLFSAACTISVSCEFTNGSGSDIAVTHIVQEKKKVVGYLKNGETLNIEHDDWRGVVQIEGFGAAKVYELNEPSGECLAFKGWGPWTRRVFRAEFRHDGQIWISCDSGAVYPIAPL